MTALSYMYIGREREREREKVGGNWALSMYPAPGTSANIEVARAYPFMYPSEKVPSAPSHMQTNLL